MIDLSAEEREAMEAAFQRIDDGSLFRDQGPDRGMAAAVFRHSWHAAREYDRQCEELKILLSETCAFLGWNEAEQELKDRIQDVLKEEKSKHEQYIRKA